MNWRLSETVPPRMKTESQPALPVSVVIPAYNRASMLARALRSVYAQQRSPSEIIVIDDASTDDTAEVASALGARVIRHAENLGEGAARNTGIRSAKFDWVALLDSDDEWLPHHLAHLWALRADHVVVGSAGTVRGEPTGRIVGQFGTRERVLRSPAAVAFPENRLTASATMFRRAVGLDLGGFNDLALAADLDFWLRILERGTGVASPVPSTIYHVHSAQVSRDRVAMTDAHLAVVRSYQGRGWCDATLIRHCEGAAAWGTFRDVRSDSRMRRWRGLVAACSDPRRASGIVRSAWHRHGRRRARWRFDEQGMSTVVVLSAVERGRQQWPPTGDPAGIATTVPRVLLAIARTPPTSAVVNTRWQRFLVRALGARPESTEASDRGSQGQPRRRSAASR